MCIFVIMFISNHIGLEIMGNKLNLVKMLKLLDLGLVQM